MERHFSALLHPEDVDKKDILGRSGERQQLDNMKAANNICQLFLRFQGPTTILVQTRASRLSDVLTSQDVAEIADAPAGLVQSMTSDTAGSVAQGSQPTGLEAPKSLKVSVASVKPDGKVTFDENARSTV